jgi:hypothetical protein
VINTTEPLENEHDHVHPDAATTHWDGTKLDHHHAVAALAQRLTSVDQRRAG